MHIKDGSYSITNWEKYSVIPHLERSPSSHHIYIYILFHEWHASGS